MHISDTCTPDFVARSLGNAPCTDRSNLRAELATLAPMTAVCLLLALLTVVATVMSGADPALLVLG